MFVRGYPPFAEVAVTETAGKMNVTGSGADIWGNSDEFTYVYETLTGDGTLVARVVGIGAGTNTWARGGVMIRDSLNGGATHAMTVLTANSDGAAGNGAWQGVVINSPMHNSVQPLYVTITDSTGKMATVANATAVNATAWTEVKFPLTGFGGVSLAKVEKLIIGVGDPANPAADGTGRIFIDDIRITRP
jgi:hypothetical protein